ncbi:restriction endonuclease-like protein [Sporosarcina luteola]|uniref:DUF2357 domain-containing protein n=1 Tax=Sporosarcina luteola TaxID=582850 RepID=UPI002042278F|nr:DUF2357 domain-containing protein [Sporosarcina luteola]MCM3638605.1 restriction endonuclease-like protein [Sporosarcina luteola]
MILYMNNNSWESIENLIFIEGKSYKLKVRNNYAIIAHGLNIIHSQGNSNIFTLNIPFHTGRCSIDLLDKGKVIYHFESYIYPDDRKMILNDYLIMISDLLKTDYLAISLSNKHFEDRFIISSNGIKTRIELQYLLVERFFSDILDAVKAICTNPIKEREKKRKRYPGYKQDKFDSNAVVWVSENSHLCFNESGKYPSYFKSKVHKNAFDVLENQIVVSIIRRLLQVCGFMASKRGILRAKKIESDISYLLKKSPFQNVDKRQPKFQKTHRIKTNRHYLFLYNLNELLIKATFDLDPNKQNLIQLPLAKTYKIYEIWSFVKIIDLLNANKKIISTINLKTGYNQKEECIDLIHGQKSRILLDNSYELYYQLTLKKNGSIFYTYTSELIPDICFIKNDKMIILDSKYRIGANIDNALAELHKYRDGIIHKTNIRAVQEAYILAPSFSSRQEVHDEAYFKKWKMGCIYLSPTNTSALEKFLNKFI